MPGSRRVANELLSCRTVTGTSLFFYASALLGERGMVAHNRRQQCKKAMLSASYYVPYLVLLLWTGSSAARQLQANAGSDASCDASQFRSSTLSTNWTSSAQLPVGWVEAWTVLPPPICAATHALFDRGPAPERIRSGTVLHRRVAGLAPCCCVRGSTFSAQQALLSVHGLRHTQRTSCGART